MRFRLIIISPPGRYENEANIIQQLFSEGLQLFHIRKPHFSKAELKDYIMHIPPKLHPQLVLHSHYSLLNEFQLKGIHLTERSRLKGIPAAFDSRKHSLSASFHDPGSISKIKRNYDYVFLSPVFDSISKKAYRGAFSESELKSFLRDKPKVIALGGIEPGRIKKIRELKFAGAATLGFIWEAKDPVRAFLRLRSKIK